MNAVVVTRAQVNRGEVAIVKGLGQLGVSAHQGLCAVGVAFGLKHLIALNASELAHRPIDRTNIGRFGQGANARF